MKQDVTECIRGAIASGITHDNSEENQQLLRWLAAQLEGSTTDWDQGAGESWARVLVGGDVVAFLFMKAPIALIANVPESLISALSARKMAIIRVDQMDSESLCSDRGTVGALAERPLSDQFDHRKFSAEDLVWATM